jgi:hypothetical protein
MISKITMAFILRSLIFIMIKRWIKTCQIHIHVDKDKGAIPLLLGEVERYGSGNNVVQVMLELVLNGT